MTDRSVGGDEIVQWARTTEFATPLRWGDVEAEILRRPAPDGEPAAGPNPVMGLPLYAIGVILYAVPLFGLGILVARVGGAISDTEAWGRAAFAAFLVALFVALTTFETWRSGGRRRRWIDLVVTAIAGGSSLVGLLLLQTDVADLAGGGLRILVLGAAVAGVLVFFAVLAGSKEWRRHTPRALRPQSPEDRSYNNVRARVLEVLVKRGVVSDKDIDIPAMLDMPIGSWRELDGHA
ncbi:hypothetical protein J2S40_004365 [Nocardioides luteus]|uniref:DUF5671 domain-containing protein n=1 Tax=Nocardioides luteus TaxID=1844 RepID=A0ABQ5SQE3_9ACTN|nr:hypothetical protein [Nocardioides luteus]MDR7313307.1 hypothetical protein [Nocardioides luteus]GGR60134.1 hypothetical protein GCM10010197_28700 [Nocardioides luteus]GLJ66372.1 hypothetical protein GCM10017579_04080 [Nocardioides luteus]